jgi:hypothetical protein
LAFSDLIALGNSEEKRAKNNQAFQPSQFSDFLTACDG